MLNILIKGCGVAGLTIGWELAKHNVKLSYYVPQNNTSTLAMASWHAGGMLAPFCERESAPQLVQDEGIKAIKWWKDNFPNYVYQNGTLVIATKRDVNELEDFAKKTNEHILLQNDAIQNLEENLANRFEKALFYKEEAHLEPRCILSFIKQKLLENGVKFIDNFQPNSYDYIIDCTGINYAKQNKELRGVRGEMLLVKCSNFSLQRNIRLLHPRIPLYIVPRANNIFMIGATMIESESLSPIVARSMMELLNAAYTLHPEFANAQIVETNVGIRPAFPNNLPAIEHNNKEIYVNGFYRHGFLLAPFIAQKIIELLIEKV